MLKVSIFIYSSVKTFSVSKANYFKPDERLKSISGWDCAAVSIGACGASDTGANPVPDLYFYLGAF